MSAFQPMSNEVRRKCWEIKLALEALLQFGAECPDMKAFLEFLAPIALEILNSLPNVVTIRVRDTLNVFGDTHGHKELYCLLSRMPLGEQVLFLGDYVDRGFYSVENVLLLLVRLVLDPHNVTLLRGNHEDRQIFTMYGLSGEVKRKVGQDADSVLDMFEKIFMAMPVAAVVESADRTRRVFAAHGGPNLDLPLDELQQVERRTTVYQTPLEQLLWNDPGSFPGASTRGAGKIFTADTLMPWLEKNGFEYLLRAHEVRKDGNSVDLVSPTGVPICYTVFSASNYCGAWNNGSRGQLDASLAITFASWRDSSSVVFTPSEEEEEEEETVYSGSPRQLSPSGSPRDGIEQTNTCSESSSPLALSSANLALLQVDGPGRVDTVYGESFSPLSLSSANLALLQLEGPERVDTVYGESSSPLALSSANLALLQMEGPGRVDTVYGEEVDPSLLEFFEELSRPSHFSPFCFGNQLNGSKDGCEELASGGGKDDPHEWRVLLLRTSSGTKPV